MTQAQTCCTFAMLMLYAYFTMTQMSCVYALSHRAEMSSLIRKGLVWVQVKSRVKYRVLKNKN